MAQFFSMDGYGGYVWSAYGLTAAVLIALSWSVWRRFWRARSRLKALERQKDSADTDA
ncbi:MAG: heme exporter protein CcmD [Parvularculaceae bacterium]|nr:heme exporter protein CcmD [Parvularculaceae bacterium]